MTLTKQEVAEALAHQQKMLRVLRQRLQQRELQMLDFRRESPERLRLG